MNPYDDEWDCYRKENESKYVTMRKKVGIIVIGVVEVVRTKSLVGRVTKTIFARIVKRQGKPRNQMVV